MNKMKYTRAYLNVERFFCKFLSLIFYKFAEKNSFHPQARFSPFVVSECISDGNRTRADNDPTCSVAHMHVTSEHMHIYMHIYMHMPSLG